MEANSIATIVGLPPCDWGVVVSVGVVAVVGVVAKIRNMTFRFKS